MSGWYQRMSGLGSYFKFVVDGVDRFIAMVYRSLNLWQDTLQIGPFPKEDMHIFGEEIGHPEECLAALTVCSSWLYRLPAMDS